MPRLRFGAFLAPHHPIGEHPMLQFRRDLDLVEQLDRLGYDEFWCGEHHSSGWEMIASPEMFLAAAGERTKRIRLATGVVSLPYHHPFNVAQRMVQLDYMTGGRAIFGSGPGALASDAHTLGIDPMVQRDRQDEAIGVIRRLMRGERVTHESDWFMLQRRRAATAAAAGGDAVRGRLADQPVGHDAGRQARDRRHLDRLADRGRPQRLADAMGLRRAGGAEARPDRRSQGLARAAVLAHRRDPREGDRRGARGAAAPSQRIHRRHVAAARREAVQEPRRGDREDRLFGAGAAATIGTPDDLVARIKSVLEISGGFGTVVGFVHDWANPENTARSWDMVARYVVPEINGYLAGLRALAALRRDRTRGVFDRAKEAIMAKVYENEAAVAALARHPRLAPRRRRLGQQRPRPGAGAARPGLAGRRRSEIRRTVMRERPRRVSVIPCRGRPSPSAGSPAYPCPGMPDRPSDSCPAPTNGAERPHGCRGRSVRDRCSCRGRPSRRR